MRNYINTDEHRLAIIENKKWKVLFFWNKLTQEKKRELFKLSLAARNFDLANLLYKSDKEVFHNMKEMLNKAGADGDKETVQFILERDKIQVLLRERLQCGIESIIFNWANSYDHIGLMNQLDYQQVTEKTGQAYFFEKLVKKGHFVSINNQVDNHPEYQLILNALNKNGITIFNSIEHIIKETIHMDGYYASEKENNDKALPQIQEIVEYYIQDEEFLKKMLEANPEQYPYENTVELKQSLLDTFLMYSLKNKEAGMAQYFVEQGAKIVIINEEAIEWILNKGSLYLVQELINTGLDLDKYKKDAIFHQTMREEIEIIKCLLSLFKNKEEVKTIINNAKNQGLTRREKNDISKIQKEIEEYIDVLIFKETLQTELPTNNTQSRHKI